jgi:hypothetical protein
VPEEKGSGCKKSGGKIKKDGKGRAVITKMGRKITIQPLSHYDMMLFFTGFFYGIAAWRLIAPGLEIAVADGPVAGVFTL